MTTRSTAHDTSRRAGSIIGAAIAIAGIATSVGADDFVAHQAIVELVPGASIAAVNADYGTSIVRSMPSRHLYLLSLPVVYDEQEFELLIEADDRIEAAELNHGTESSEGQTQSFFLSIEPRGYFSQPTWTVIHLDAGQAESSGSGILVAVLDTGVDATHEALAGRIAPGGWDFVNETDTPADGGDGLDTDGDGFTDEMVGHGTFVAGVIAHMAPDAMILPVKVLDADGIADSFLVGAGIYHAIDGGADIINLSLGQIVENDFISQAVEAAHAAGITVIASGGNHGVEEPVQFPADFDEVIGVAATDVDDEFADFSNFGSPIAICAPGVDVGSTVPSDEYGAWSGTSMSAAVISGAAALLRGHCPDATPEDIRTWLLDGASDLDAINPEHAGKMGAGRLDLEASLLLACPPTPFGDLDGDGTISASDLAILLGSWNGAGGAADLDGDGTVGPGDLALLLLHWS